MGYIDLIDKLTVEPNSNPLGIKRFVLCTSISFKYESDIIMQIQDNPGRFELGTKLG